MLEKLNFTVKGKTYQTEEVIVGRMIDLWKMRTAISMGSYGLMYRIGMTDSDEILTMINVEAFFTVFCPDFISDMKPTSIKEMGLKDYSELRDVYVSQIEPWLSEVESFLKKKE